MAQHVSLTVPLNRVEGDLELRVEVSDDVVVDAWCSGTLFRGFERLLVGRGALDGLVITPRICGICSTGHLTAAARALDAIAHATPPPDAVRVRNVALMAEHVQSDVRHAALMFAVDFANPAYQRHPLFPEALRRYEPLRGETALQVLRETKRVLEIVAILGGQWPHSSFIVPGGVVAVPAAGDLLQCRLLLQQCRLWYERRILGCTVERWQAVRSAAELQAWLTESAAHRDGDLGFLIRLARELGLDRVGQGHGSFVSFGALDLPADTAVAAPGGDGRLIPAGLWSDGELAPFDAGKVAEDVGCSWAADYPGARHPFDGETRPYATGQEAGRYSWAKAPRYDGRPAETGPLAELLVAGSPLFADLVARGGPSAFVRQLARLVRPATLLPAMATWLAEATGDGSYYVPPGEVVEGEGAGLTHAARGALGHWVQLRDGAIERYQIITPTAWNASPRDSAGVRGPLEQALIGTPVRDVENPVEVGHVVRSFDPCLVCTVHAVR